jgi:hypothetical protein
VRHSLHCRAWLHCRCCCRLSYCLRVVYISGVAAGASEQPSTLPRYTAVFNLCSSVSLLHASGVLLEFPVSVVSLLKYTFGFAFCPVAVFTIIYAPVGHYKWFSLLVMSALSTWVARLHHLRSSQWPPSVQRQHWRGRLPNYIGWRQCMLASINVCNLRLSSTSRSCLETTQCLKDGGW